MLAIILLHSENRGLNKRISESEASQPPARPAAAPCRRHHGIRRPRGRSNPRRVGGMHVFRRLDGVRRLDDLHHLEGEGGGRAAPRRHATKLWAVAVPYGDSGNWRSHRVSELSRSGEIPNSAAAEVVLRGGRATTVSADEALAQPLCQRGGHPAHARRPRDGPAIDQQSSGGASPSAPHACSFKLPLIPTFQPARETSQRSTAKSGDRSR